VHEPSKGFKIKYWEIGNEGDISENGSSPYLFSSANYVNYDANTAEAILRADPTAKVGGPTLANVGSPIGSALIAAAGSGSVKLDFFSWHVYTNDPWSIARSVQRVRSQRSRYPALANTQTLISEWNIDLNNPNLTAGFQPAFVMQATRLFHDYGVSMSAYYHVRDYHVDEREFLAFISPAGALTRANWWNVHPQYDGLFDFQGTARPTYRVYRWLSQFAGQELTITGTNSELNGYAIKSGNSLKAILWNFSTTGNSYGAAIRLPSSTGGYYEISHVNATSSAPDLVARGTVSSLAGQPINVTFSQFDSYLVQTHPVQFTPSSPLLFSAQQNGANLVSQDISVAYNGTSSSTPFSAT
jgi:hypothetical protein